jgi:hypothetical protein
MIALILLCFLPIIVSGTPAPSAFRTVVPSDRRGRVQAILVAQKRDANDTLSAFANSTIAPFEIEVVKESEVRPDAAVVDHIIIQMGDERRRITHRDFLRLLLVDTPKDVWVVAGLGIAFIIGCVMILLFLK